MNRMTAKGDTALWDAPALASDQLKHCGEKFKTVKKRIICLSDGADTKSSRKAYDVCNELLQNEIVVDSFCLGDEDNSELRALSYLTGGYRIVPKTLEQAMAMCEMEPMLSQLERPPIVRQASFRLASAMSLRTMSHLATHDVVSRDVFPQRRRHPNLSDNFIELSGFTGRTGSTIAPGDRSNANIRPVRLLAEVRNAASNPHPHYEVFVSETSMVFWKVLMQAPPEGPYSQGTFVLYVHMEDDFPALPPKARFCTPIIHPNINRHGRVCHSILDRK